LQNLSSWEASNAIPNTIAYKYIIYYSSIMLTFGSRSRKPCSSSIHVFAIFVMLKVNSKDSRTTATWKSATRTSAT